MVQKSGDHQLRWQISRYLQGFVPSTVLIITCTLSRMIIHFATLVGVSSQLMDLRNKISAVKVFVAFVISFQKKNTTPGFLDFGHVSTSKGPHWQNEKALENGWLLKETNRIFKAPIWGRFLQPIWMATKIWLPNVYPPTWIISSQFRGPLPTTYSSPLTTRPPRHP